MRRLLLMQLLAMIVGLALGQPYANYIKEPITIFKDDPLGCDSVADVFAQDQDSRLIDPDTTSVTPPVTTRSEYGQVYMIGGRTRSPTLVQGTSNYVGKGCLQEAEAVPFVWIGAAKNSNVQVPKPTYLIFDAVINFGYDIMKFSKVTAASFPQYTEQPDLKCANEVTQLLVSPPVRHIAGKFSINDQFVFTVETTLQDIPVKTSYSTFLFVAKVNRTKTVPSVFEIKLSKLMYLGKVESPKPRKLFFYEKIYKTSTSGGSFIMILPNNKLPMNSLTGTHPFELTEIGLTGTKRKLAFNKVSRFGLQSIYCNYNEDGSSNLLYDHCFLGGDRRNSVDNKSPDPMIFMLKMSSKASQEQFAYVIETGSLSLEKDEYKDSHYTVDVLDFAVTGGGSNGKGTYYGLSVPRNSLGNDQGISLSFTSQVYLVYFISTDFSGTEYWNQKMPTSLTVSCSEPVIVVAVRMGDRSDMSNVFLYRKLINSMATCDQQDTANQDTYQNQRIMLVFASNHQDQGPVEEPIYIGTNKRFLEVVNILGPVAFKCNKANSGTFELKMMTKPSSSWEAGTLDQNYATTDLTTGNYFNQHSIKTMGRVVYDATTPYATLVDAAFYSKQMRYVFTSTSANISEPFVYVVNTNKYAYSSSSNFPDTMSYGAPSASQFTRSSTNSNQKFIVIKGMYYDDSASLPKLTSTFYWHFFERGTCKSAVKPIKLRQPKYYNKDTEWLRSAFTLVESTMLDDCLTQEYDFNSIAKVSEHQMILVNDSESLQVNLTNIQDLIRSVGCKEGSVSCRSCPNVIEFQLSESKGNVLVQDTDLKINLPFYEKINLLIEKVYSINVTARFNRNLFPKSLYHQVFAIYHHMNFFYLHETKPKTPYSGNGVYLDQLILSEEPFFTVPDCRPVCGSTRYLPNRFYKMTSQRGRCFMPTQPLTDNDFGQFDKTSQIANEVGCPPPIWNPGYDHLIYYGPQLIELSFGLGQQPFIVDLRDYFYFSNGFSKDIIYWQNLGWFNTTQFTQPLTAELLADGSWSFTTNLTSSYDFPETTVTFVTSNKFTHALSNIYDPDHPERTKLIRLKLSVYDDSCFEALQAHEPELVEITSLVTPDDVFSHEYLPRFEESFKMCNLTEMKFNLRRYGSEELLDQADKRIKMEEGIVTVTGEAPNHLRFRLVMMIGETKAFTHTVFMVNSDRPLMFWNLPPVFNDNLPKAFVIHMIKLKDGTMVTNSSVVYKDKTEPLEWKDDTFEFTTPKASDPEGDTISADFVFPSLIWIKVKRDKEVPGLLTVKLYRHLMTESYQGAIRIKLNDVTSSMSFTTYSIAINITVENEVYQNMDELLRKSIVKELKEKGRMSVGQLESKARGSFQEVLRQRQRDQTEQRLVQAGGTKIEGVGVTFPGVKVPPNVEKKTQTPRMRISSIDKSHKLVLSFDQTMYFPEVVDPNFYKNIVNISYVQDQAPETEFGASFRSPETNITRSLRSIDSKEAAFDLIILEHSSSKLAMQLNLSQVGEINSGVLMDRIQIHFSNPEVFISAESNKTLNLSGRKQDTIIKYVPHIVDEDLELQMWIAASGMMVMIQGVVLVQLILAYKVGASLQTLFGMARTFSFLFYLGVLNVPQPVHLVVFFQKSKWMAQLDIFHYLRLNNYVFFFRETEPYNEAYEQLEVESKNFITNTGSFLLLLVLTLLAYFKNFALHTIALRFHKRSFWRSVGMKTYKANWKATLARYVFKLMEIFYFDLMIAVLLQFYAYSFDTGPEGYHLTGSDKFCTYFMSVTFALSIVLLLSSFIVVVYYFKRLSFYSVAVKLSFLIDDTKIMMMPQAISQGIYLLRRLLAAIVIVCMPEHPFFQLQLLLLLSLASMSYTCSYRPLRKFNTLEQLNETSIYVATLLLLNNMNLKMQKDKAAYMGWVTIGLIVITVLGNLMFSMKISCGEFWTDKRLKAVQVKLEQIKNERRQLKDQVINKFPNQSQYYQNAVEEEKAIEFLKTWNKQRNWLRKNRIDFSSFPEEFRSQELIQKFDLKTKAKLSRFKNSIYYLAEKKTQEEIAKRAHETKTQNRPQAPKPKPERTKEKIVSKAKNLKMHVIPEDENENQVTIQGERAPEKVLLNKNKVQLENKSILLDIVEFDQQVQVEDRKKEISQILKIQIATSMSKTVITRNEMNKLIKKDQAVSKRGGDTIVSEQRSLGLEFLLEQDHEEYGDELEEKLREGERLMLMFDNSHSICRLNKGGKNDNIQAVLQCFLRIRDLAEYFLTKSYIHPLKVEDFPVLSKQLHEIYKESCVSDEDVDDKELEVVYDLRLLMNLMPPPDETQVKNNGYTFFTELFNRLLLEADLDLEAEPTTTRARILNKVFIMTGQQLKFCDVGHQIECESHSLPWLFFNPERSVRQTIQKFFDNDRKRGPCKECKNDAQLVYSLRIMTVMPKVLVIIFNLVNLKGDIKKFKESDIPLELDLNQFVGGKFRDKQKPAIYELQSILDLQGYIMRDSTYTAYVQRRDPETYEVEWNAISFGKRKVVPETSINKLVNPQMLVYERQ